MRGFTIGDCTCNALALLANEELLFKGDGFPKTAVASAIKEA